MHLIELKIISTVCSAILCLGCCYIGELLHLEEDATVDGLQAYVRLLITSSVCFYLFP